MSSRRTFLLSVIGLTTTYALSSTLLEQVGDNIGLCTPNNEENVKAGRYDNINTPPAEDAFSQLYRDEQKQFTLVGESNHTDGAISEFFYSDENIGYMAASGVKHVCIEWDISNQRDLDELQNETISPEEFTKRWKTNWGTENFQKKKLLSFAKGVQKLGKLGIKVHGIDTADQDTQNAPATERLYTGLSKFHQRMCGEELPLTSRSQAAYFVTNLGKLFNAFGDRNRAQNERANDTGRVSTIREKCGQEKAVIFMGSGHFSGTARSIKNFFRDQSNHVELFGSLSFFEKTHYTPPSFFFFIKERKAIEPKIMKAASEQGLLPIMERSNVFQ